MATNRSIQLMLHAVYIKPPPPPLPSSLQIQPEPHYTVHLEKGSFLGTELVSNMPAIRPRNVKGGSPPRGLHKSRGKMHPPIETPSASLI